MSILQSVFNRVKPHLVLAVVCGFIFLASGIVSAGVVNGTFFNSALKIFGQNASGNSVTVTNGSITSSSGQLQNQSGNLTTINGVSLGTNSAGNMTSTTVTGLGTFVGVKVPYSTLQGSSNGSTVSYALPAYGTSAVLGSTAHIVSGSRTTGTTGTVTISLTGAAVFSNANYFAYCLDDTTGAKSPGSAQTTSSFSCAMGAIGATDIMHYYAIGI